MPMAIVFKMIVLVKYLIFYNTLYTGISKHTIKVPIKKYIYISNVIIVSVHNIHNHEN